jgi:hypothetical protein
MKIQVFDPPMCCSTGVCGPGVDPALVQFAADLEWFKEQGVTVERFNLSHQPRAFATTQLVKEALAKEGNDCLPLTVVDGKVAYKGRYPSRRMLAGFAQVDMHSSAKQADVTPCCCGPAPRRGSMGSKNRGTGCC